MDDTVRVHHLAKEIAIRDGELAWWVECPSCGWRTADLTAAEYAIEDWNAKVKGGAE